MPDSILPPTPRQLMLGAGGPNFKDMFNEAASMGALPLPDPKDIDKLATGFIPNPADVAKLGQQMVTGGVTDKVLIASAIVTPPLLVGTLVVGTVGVILLASKGGAP